VPTAGDEYIFTGEGVLLFFYVDDIVILSLKEQKARADEVVKTLKATYEMHNLGEMRSFLGITITRNRKIRRRWMSHEQYITELAAF